MSRVRYRLYIKDETDKDIESLPIETFDVTEETTVADLESTICRKLLETYKIIEVVTYGSIKL